MKTVIKILIALVIIGAVIFLFIKNKDTAKDSEIGTGQASILGCYVASIAKDQYVLTIESNQGDSVSGTLAFNNFEKDSSHGTFSGSYKDGILFGDYRFSSEGTDSVREVIFKKSDSGFIEGFGEMKVSGNKESFVDKSSVAYDPKVTFVRSNACVEAETAMVNSVVINFGANMKQVSVLAPQKTLEQSIDTYYAPFITPSLLNTWKKNPSMVPGRETSSPWPEKIEIISTTKNSDGTYTVSASVIEAVTGTNGSLEEIGGYVAKITLEKMDGTWRISKFERFERRGK